MLKEAIGQLDIHRENFGDSSKIGKNCKTFLSHNFFWNDTKFEGGFKKGKCASVVTCFSVMSVFIHVNHHSSLTNSIPGKSSTTVLF